MTESAPSQADTQTPANHQQTQASNSPATTSNSSNLQTPRELGNPRSLTGRILRWLRYVCLMALALLIGYVSRDWSRPPIWKKRVPIFTMIAGVSESRNEIVLVSQFDQGNKPIYGRSTNKRKKDDPPNPRSHEYELVPVAELVFEDPSTKQPVFPKTITIETCELSSGKVTKSLTVKTDNIYSSAGLNERTVTLGHHSGGVLQIDCATGATITNKSFLGQCLFSPTGEHWVDTKNIFRSGSGDAICELTAGIKSGFSIGGFTWSPDGSKFAFVLEIFNETNDSVQTRLAVFDVTDKTTSTIQCSVKKSEQSFYPRLCWLDNQHVFLANKDVTQAMRNPNLPFEAVGCYQCSGRELVKVPTSWFEVDLRRVVVTRQQFPNGTWFAQGDPVPGEWQQQLVKVANQSQIRWLIELVQAYHRNRSTRFELRTEPESRQTLVTVAVTNSNEFRLSEQNQYLVTSTVVRPTGTSLSREMMLDLTQQWVSVYNFRPAALPTWLFQLIVATIAFPSLLLATALLNKLCSIVSRWLFRQRTT